MYDGAIWGYKDRRGIWSISVNKKKKRKARKKISKLSRRKNRK